MRKIAILILALAALFCSQNISAQSVITRSGIENPEKWINTVFAQGKVPPFSFAYEEISSAKFITDWRFSKKKIASGEKGVVEYIVSYTNPEGTLRVTCDVKGYSDSKAVEWYVKFKNISRYNTSKIAVVKSADYKLSEPSAKGFTARYAKGCNGAKDDFQTEEVDLRAGVLLEFTPEDGLSSKGSSLPFYNIISRDADAGLALAVGWTGRWNVELRGVTSVEYKLFAGLEKANFYLKPGEEVRTPLVATVLWKGSDPAAGQNALRSFLIKHHSPKVGGRLWNPTLGGFDFGSPAPCKDCECLTDDLAKATVQRYKQLDILPEVFILDRGWNAACGDWSPKEDLFPEGFSSLSSLIHSYGSKLMLRFDPENVDKASPLAKECPDYMMLGGKGYQYIYDFSQSKAVDYICKYIGDLMEQGGVDGLVCGFSGDLAHYWDLADGVDRTGVVEMKYVAGLYRFWDYIAKRFPGCALECSASGTRMDMEVLSRSLVVRSRDYDVSGLQGQGYFLSMFVPLNAAAALSPLAYDCRSCTSGLFYSDFSLFSSKFNSEDMRSRKDQWEEFGGYLLKDYYPLCGTVPLQHEDLWIAEQYHDASDGSGIIIAFRRSLAENVTFAAGLRGVKTDAVYELRDCATGKTETVSGRELANGFRMTLEEPRSSLLIRYKLK